MQDVLIVWSESIKKLSYLIFFINHSNYFPLTEIIFFTGLDVHGPMHLWNFPYGILNTNISIPEAWIFPFMSPWVMNILFSVNKSFLWNHWVVFPIHFVYLLEITQKTLLLSPSHSDSEKVEYPRTYLSVFPTFTEAICSFNYLCISFRTTIRSTGGVVPKHISYGLLSRCLAHRLHACSHLHPDYLCVIFDRAGILSSSLKHSIHTVSDKCRSCVQTGRPHRSKKVSLSEILASFNENAQIDYIWITELTYQPILHIADVAK